MKYLTILMIVLASGCAEPIQHATPSGRPEVTIQAPMDAINTQIVNRMIDKGYQVRLRTANRIVMEHPATGTFGYGSRYDPNPMARTTFDLIEVENRTRVVLSMAIVTNAGSAFEQLTSMDNAAPSQVGQEWLLKLKEWMERPTTTTP